MANLIKKPSESIQKKPESKISVLTYKIAFPTDDGKFIAEHWGRAAAFLVAEIQGKEIIAKDLRPNDSHENMPEHTSNHEHNHDPQQQASAHDRIADILFDVDIIIAKKMGPRAIDDLSAKGYTIYLTQISSIDDALKAHIMGKL